MSTQSRTIDQFAAHAVCIAASVRDMLRTAQFYSRDMSNVDGGLRADNSRPTLPSRFVAILARWFDAGMTWAANASIALFLPSWRKLPSPFELGMVGAVADAIRDNRLLHNPIFNAYFFRAAKHITEHYAERPNLVLEHRVDAARRTLAGEPGGTSSVDASFMARLLLALVEAKPVARMGPLRQRNNLLGDADPNISVFAIAIIALLFAESGKPVTISDTNEFFRIVGALIQPRLPHLAAAIAARDTAALSTEISRIQSLY